jgi:hypothetical protein
MKVRAYWQFYKEMAPFVFAFTALCLALFGLLWGMLLHFALAPILGLLGFNALKKEQFYFYYNMGITKKRLIGSSYLINGLLGVPLSFLFTLLYLLFRGGTPSF